MRAPAARCSLRTVPRDSVTPGVTEKAHSLNNLLSPQLSSGSLRQSHLSALGSNCPTRLLWGARQQPEQEKGESCSVNAVLVSTLAVPARHHSNSDGARADRGGRRATEVWS